MTAPPIARRNNPLRTFRFRIRLHPPPTNARTAPGGYVAGVKTVSGLNLSVNAAEVWEGGNNLHRYANPNRVSWEPITLEQGLALDDSLEKWALAVVEYARTGKAPTEPLKRTVIIDVWDEHVSTEPPPTATDGGSRAFRIHNAWISRYNALPKLDAMASEAALLTVELVHEGWEPYAHAH